MRFGVNYPILYMCIPTQTQVEVKGKRIPGKENKSQHFDHISVTPRTLSSPCFPGS